MKRITITIETGNAAFDDDNGRQETARILEELAWKLRYRPAEEITANMRDFNGNVVGRVEVKD